MEISDCCRENIIDESIDMCSKCFEHCEVIVEDDFDEIMSLDNKVIINNGEIINENT